MLFDCGDLDDHVWLFVAVFLEISALCLVFDDDDFLVVAGFLEEGFNGRSSYIRGADSRVLAVVDEEDFVEYHLIAKLEIALEFLDAKEVSDRDLVLLAARMDYREFLVCHMWVPFYTKTGKKQPPYTKSPIVALLLQIMPL